jgi:hypothetical protein
MPNTEIFELHSSFINTIRVFFNWNLSIYSPTDTIETDTFYLAYTNQSTSETVVVDTGNTMNHVLELSPETIYSVVVYSINSLSEQSANSAPPVIIHTGNDYTNPINANGYLRVYETTELTNITIENLKDVVTVSSVSSGAQSSEPTFVDIVTSSSPKPFYQIYKIDPKGQLFGTTFCTEANFKKRVITI